MFSLSLHSQEILDTAHLYYLFEEEHPGSLTALYEQLDSHISYIPEHFHDAIAKRLFHLDKLLIDSFVAWCKHTIEQHNKSGEEKYATRKTVIADLSQEVQDVFSQTFHDGQILAVSKQAKHISLLLNMSGGFTKQSIIKLIFQDAVLEGVLQGYYLYDELIKHEKGYGLRILSSYGSPNVEATIFFKSVSVECLYKPAAYYDSAKFTSLNDYVAALNPDHRYYIVEHENLIEIDISKVKQEKSGIYFEHYFLGDTLEQTIQCIHSSTFEDAFAKFKIPIPEDELLESIFGTDIDKRARALNTITSCGNRYASIANEALRAVDTISYDDMYFFIIKNHLIKFDCIDEDNKKKWVTD